MAVVETWWTGVLGGMGLRRLALHHRDTGMWAVEYETGSKGDSVRFEEQLTEVEARARMQYAMGRHPGDRWVRTDTWVLALHGPLVVDRDIQRDT